MALLNLQCSERDRSRRLKWEGARICVVTAVCSAMVALGLCGSAWAQPSLADLARREAERRKAVASPGKVYTNEDAKRGGGNLTTAAAQPPKQAGAVAAAPDDPPAAQPGLAKSPESIPKADASNEPVHDEEWWRKQVTELRDQLSRSRLFGEALQSRINALWADFTARDDPAQRSVLAKDRDDALAELERAKKDATRLQQEVEELEEAARKADVPPGWLR